MFRGYRRVAGFGDVQFSKGYGVPRDMGDCPEPATPGLDFPSDPTSPAGSGGAPVPPVNGVMLLPSEAPAGSGKTFLLGMLAGLVLYRFLR